MASGLLKEYLGRGPVADRPTTPDLQADTAGFWYDPATGLSTWDGSAWDSIGGGGGSSLEVQEDGGSIETGVDVINFTGSGVTVTNTGAGEVEVDISGGGGGGGAGSHRYWGLLNLSGQTGNVQLLKFHLYDGGVRQTVSDYTASSRFNGSYDADNLLTDTTWAASGLSAWVYADLGSAKTIDDIRLEAPSGALDQAPFTVTVACSDDAENWTILSCYTRVTWVVSTMYTIPVEQ